MTFESSDNVLRMSHLSRVAIWFGIKVHGVEVTAVGFSMDQRGIVRRNPREEISGDRSDGEVLEARNFLNAPIGNADAANWCRGGHVGMNIDSLAIWSPHGISGGCYGQGFPCLRRHVI